MRGRTAVAWLLLGSIVTPTVQAQDARTLRIVLAQPIDARDPHRSERPGGWLLARLLHRGLYGFPNAPYPAGAQPRPDVATALPRFGPDGRTATISIRGGLRFPDGTTVDAAAVVASLDRFLAAGTELASTLPIARVTAVGPRTLRIALHRPVRDLAWSLAHPSVAIVPPSVGATLGTLPGLGPYRVDVDRPEGVSRLVRNGVWRDDPLRAAPVPGIAIAVAADGPAAFAAVEEGTADVVGDPGPPDAFVPGTPAPLESLGRCVRLLLVEPRGILSTPAHRRGIARSARGALDDAPAAGLIPPSMLGARSARVAAPGAPTRLARPLTLTVTDTVRDRVESRRLVKALAPMARVQVRRVAPARLDRALTARPRTDLVLLTWCGSVPGAGGGAFLEPLIGPSGLVARTATLDALLRAARAAPEDERAAAWGRVEGRLASEAIVIPLGFPAERGAFGPRLIDPLATPMFPQGDPAHLRL